MWNPPKSDGWTLLEPAKRKGYLKNAYWKLGQWLNLLEPEPMLVRDPILEPDLIPEPDPRSPLEIRDAWIRENNVSTGPTPRLFACCVR